MDQITLAIAHLKANDDANISSTAREFGVNRSTLSRRFNGVTGSVQSKAENQMILSYQQERTLVKYLNTLSERGLPPTPSMLCNFVYDIAKRRPERGWVPAFCKRHKDEILSIYLQPLDKDRKFADNKISYELYFQLIERKRQEYEIKPENTYNMDEKGFLIGFMTKAKRIVSRKQFEQKKIIGNTQDGNREWLTVVACICADGTHLPPGLIYQAKTGNIQDTWVQDFDSNTHNAFFASSEKGWTDNNLGFAWLTQLFDRYTKDKAGRDRRLLFVDGHGSHINMPFLEWCNRNRVLVAVYPPHSTHRLQPLDVSVFGPLGVYYSQELDRFMHSCQGLSSVTKRDFFRLFDPAWKKALSTHNIASGWMKTGLFPFNPLAVLSSFVSIEEVSRPPTGGSGASHYSILSASDWRTLKGILHRVVADELDVVQYKEVQKLSNTIEAITTENHILKAENEQFKIALNLEKKKRKRGKGLFEELRSQDKCAATFFSPKKIDQAKAIQAQKEQEKEDQKVAKQIAKEETAARQYKKKVEVEQRKQERLQRAADKVAQKAEKAAMRAQQKEAKEAGKQLQESLQQFTKRPRKPKKVATILPVEEPVNIEVEKPASRVQGNSQPQRTARQNHKLQL